MRYYIVTTTKFADECLKFLTYGATQSNWLANVDIGDILFLSQFNYKSQNLFGPLHVSKSLFYNKDIICPQQKYFYRIQFEPMEEIKIIEETDLYLNGIQSKNMTLFVRIINLIQQNKHLHCITLTNDEGRAVLETIQQNGRNYDGNLQKSQLTNELETINCLYLWEKNKLDKRKIFSSESDLEAYLILSLKNPESRAYNNLNNLLNKYADNDLHLSEVYNQFIFGNAYPSDVTILNQTNMNVLELKKGELTPNVLQQLEKEVKKHLYYSVFSDRVKAICDGERFNFYLICSKHSGNTKFKQSIIEKYDDLCRRIGPIRENTVTFVEYTIKDNEVFFEEI
jgi:hypothetical protein